MNKPQEIIDMIDNKSPGTETSSGEKRKSLPTRVGPKRFLLTVRDSTLDIVRSKYHNRRKKAQRIHPPELTGTLKLQTMNQIHKNTRSM